MRDFERAADETVVHEDGFRQVKQLQILYEKGTAEGRAPLSLFSQALKSNRGKVVSSSLVGMANHQGGAPLLTQVKALQQPNNHSVTSTVDFSAMRQANNIAFKSFFFHKKFC